MMASSSDKAATSQGYRWCSISTDKSNSNVPTSSQTPADSNLDLLKLSGSAFNLQGSDTTLPASIGSCALE